MGVMRGFVHRFEMVVHRFSFRKLRLQLGFSPLSTNKLSGYYDYLYIYKSRYETNLLKNWGRR